MTEANAAERWVGECWLCPADLHAGDTGAIVHDAGYMPVCEACARRNLWALCSPIGPLVRSTERFLRWTVR